MHTIESLPIIANPWPKALVRPLPAMVQATLIGGCERHVLESQAHS